MRVHAALTLQRQQVLVAHNTHGTNINSHLVLVAHNTAGLPAKHTFAVSITFCWFRLAAKWSAERPRSLGAETWGLEQGVLTCKVLTKALAANV